MNVLDSDRSRPRCTKFHPVETGASFFMLIGVVCCVFIELVRMNPNFG